MADGSSSAHGPGACCSVSRHGSAAEVHDAPANTPLRGRTSKDAGTADMRRLPSAIFQMGTDAPTFPADGEGPVRRVRVPAFWIDRHAVTNRRFAAFVHDTGYRTEAERYGWSFVFHAFVPEALGPTRAAPPAPWWRQVFGAAWHAPEGPGSDVEDRLDHPVVHVSWNDAVAFAAWEGKRLPSEAEWEYAARGGLHQALFPWGDDLTPGSRHRCNVWQGTFPEVDTAEDGFAGTAPVDAFEPNGYGLYNVTGNAWEWCADWFGVQHGAGPLDDPRGPSEGPGRVIKGGSYLCHASYCNRYRVAARTYNTPDSSTGHMGFRLVRDV